MKDLTKYVVQDSTTILDALRESHPEQASLISDVELQILDNRRDKFDEFVSDVMKEYFGDLSSKECEIIADYLYTHQAGFRIPTTLSGFEKCFTDAIKLSELLVDIGEDPVPFYDLGEI